MFMWAGGIASHFFWGRPPAGARWASPLFLMLAAALAISTASRPRWPILLAGATGLLSEVVGVATGVPFGPYAYTPTLGLAVFGVPLTIACAWIILTAYARAIFGPERILLPALWMTAIDLVIDPLAAHELGYWKWLTPGPYFGIPLSNFAGWFAVSLAIFALCRFRATVQHAWLGLSVVAFFALIAAAHGLWIPASAGLLLAGLHLTLYWGAACHQHRFGFARRIFHLQLFERIHDHL